VGAGRGGPVHNIQLVLTSDNFKELIFFSENLSKFIKKNIKEIVDITTSKAKDVKEYNVNVNLDLARDVGLNPLEMANGVRTLFEGEKVGQMEDDTGRFDIRVQIVPTDKSKLQNISNVTFKNDKEERLTLGLVSSTDEILAPASIERYDGQKQITVLANYTAKDLNNVISQIQEYVRKNAPPSISINSINAACAFYGCFNDLFNLVRSV